MGKKIGKLLLKVFGGILILLVLLLLLLRLPFVQTKIANYVAGRLSKQLETHISIEKVAMNFVDNATVKGIYIEDQARDTLLYSDAISVDIAFFKLIKKFIEIDQLTMNTGIIKVNQNQDSVFNFQFIVDAFASEDTASVATEPTFLIDLDRVKITHVRMQADLIDGNHSLDFDELLVKISKFDLVDQALVFDNIDLDGLKINSLVSPSLDTTVNISEPNMDTLAMQMAFPLSDFPFAIDIKQLKFNDANISMKEKGFEETEIFDPRFIQLNDLSFELQELQLDTTQLKGAISNLSMNLNQKFTIDELTTKFELTEEAISLDDLLFKAMNSSAKASLKAQFDTFNDLIVLDEQNKISFNIPEIKLAINDIAYFIPSEELAPFKNETLTLYGKGNGTLSNLLLENLHLSVGNTLINARGRILNATNPDKLGVQNFKLDGKADYEEYAVFLTNDTIKAQLREIGDIKMVASADGNMRKLNITNFEIYTESLAQGQLNGAVENLSDTDKLRYDLNILHLTSGYQDAAIFVDSLPEMVEKFDTIKYIGTLKGDLYDIALNGNFTTSLGDISTDINANFNQDYTNASYSGSLALEEFDLRRLLENDSFNTVSLQVQLDGEGLDTESIKSQIKGTVSEFGYNNYVYNDFRIDGFIDGKKFRGLASIDDENVKFDFEGSVDMNDSIPLLAFRLSLDTLNLQKLNLADSMFQIQLKIDADIAGINPDEADGKVTIRNIKLSKEDKIWATDSVKLTANHEIDNQGLNLEAEFIKASIEGDYQLTVLPDAILDFLDQYFPLKTFLGSTEEEDEILNPQEAKAIRNDVMDATISVFNITELAQFFDIPITQFDTTQLDLTLDLPNNLTNFSFNLPSIIYDGYYIENVTASAENTPDEVVSVLNIDSISITESVHLSEVNLNMVFKEQSATVNGLIRNQKNEQSLDFTTVIRSSDRSEFTIDMIKDFVLNDQRWNLDQESSILVGGDGFVIPRIEINNGKEEFGISGTSDQLNLTFEDFNLNNLIEIVGIDSLNVSGLMNGDLELGLNDQTPISGDLMINDIFFNEFNIGDLDLEAIKDGQDVTAILSLKGEEVIMDGDVSYDLSSSYIFGKVLVEKLNLEPFNPFVIEYVDQLRGAMQGYIAFDGQLEDPLVTGALYFQEVEAFVKDLGTKYKIKEGRINLAEGVVKPTATLEDQAGRLSYLKGEITHTYFDDVAFNLEFNADEFQFLNSARNKREYYYGSLVGQVKANITGTLDIPVITADILALEGTDFTVQLLSSEAVLTQEDYIIFYDGSIIDSEEAIDSITRKIYEPNGSIELNLDIKTTDEALFHVIIDPVTGDRLDIRGTSNLLVTIPAYGDISLVGEYTVSEGNYRVSYENTIRRTFALDAGSKIVFQGDPYNARLDMRAIYSADVNTFALLERSGSNIADDRSGSLRTEVNVVLNVEGTLANPELSFDIVLPESTTSPVGNSITTALAQLRQNETELLEQVGSIILFNSFIGGSTGGNISNVGTSTAISSVGNLINGQLNKLASRADGFQIDFQLDQYKDVSRDGNANVTEFGIGLQQKLFNDRLIISAGGNANLETGQSTTNNFSSFAGDFVIQYILTKNGKLRVKVFQKSDYNALSNDNVWKTGAGLTYKTKFGQIKPKE